jgi:predicted nucleotidyltransferase
LKTVGLADVIRDALKPLSDRVRWAFVYGSVARSEERSTSDVDLMIIGHVGLGDVSGPLRKAERRLNRALNPTTYTADEFTSAR